MTTIREGLVRTLTSRENPAFREIAGIASSARDRKRAGASFLEGIHLCEAYVQWHGTPLTVVHTAQALADPMIARLVRVPAARRFELSPALFREISQLDHGVGLAYVVSTPAPVLPEAIVDDMVFIDRVQDPGNVGALLRACAAAGVRRVVTAPGTAFCWSPKVLRAGMGAHFALDIHESIEWSALAVRLRIPVLATAGQGADSLWSLDLQPHCAWVFGNEGAGIDPQLLAGATQRVRIPQVASVESLNVASAAAVCLFEQRRQRTRGR